VSAGDFIDLLVDSILRRPQRYQFQLSLSVLWKAFGRFECR
jgi:hypothetical protein